jgi:hypothetical protein
MFNHFGLIYFSNRLDLVDGVILLCAGLIAYYREMSVRITVFKAKTQ